MNTRQTTIGGWTSRLWRCLPKGPRRWALSRCAALLAPKPDPRPPPCAGAVVVAGEIEAANGLGESARILHGAIGGLGVGVSSQALGLPGLTAMPITTLPPGAALLAVVNAPFLPAAIARLERGALRTRPVVGYWAWELPVAPPAWRAGARFVHEIWAPSAFCATAFAPLKPGRVRVVPLPLAAMPLQILGTRAAFGLPEQCFIVTVCFNLASSFARKNPLAAIAAFKAAFGASRDHLLVLKLAHPEAYAHDLATIRHAVAGQANIRLITATLSDEQLRGLLACADVVLSLHRAEGFGLVPATAMLLGRAVVATGWSGNMEYMAPDAAGLVEYRLVPAQDERGTYAVPGARWAEPDTEHAAALLRALADTPEARAAQGRAGQALARARLGDAPLRAALEGMGVPCMC
ncbi:glycosyltransferase [Acidocella sp.]|uniref:glycosyltransferase n=1 Tax=Acidocella sp. TaxID=50710 RepID=UPI002614D162|nr:glycosyltransferase family 1 protein [Acidocella sp.]